MRHAHCLHPGPMSPPKPTQLSGSLAFNLGRKSGRIILTTAISCLASCWIGLEASAATINASSASYSDVNTAVAAAKNGDTVRVPAGNFTWSSTLNVGSKAISIIGAGIGSTIINNTAGCAVRWTNPGDNLVRLSGIRFNNADQMPVIVHIAGPAYKVRVDNCYFNKGDCGVGTNDFRVQQGNGPVWGVVDHCQFYNMKRPYYAMDERVGTVANQLTPAWRDFLANPSSFPGSQKMMFFEDNQFVWDANMTDKNGQCALYGSNSGMCCFRYNTVTGSDYQIDAHGGVGDGTIYYEIYNNTFIKGNFNGGQGLSCWNRGGQWIVHNNTFTNTSFPFAMSVYFTYDSAECRTKNCYFWGNTWNGNGNQSSMVAVRDSGQTPAGYSASNIRINQEFFLNAPQPGQPYYPYKPYTYPHPLVTGGGAAPTPAPTATPTPAATASPTATPSATPVSTPIPSPTPTPTPLGLSFGASAGVINTPFIVNSDGTVSQSVESSDPIQGGEATYTFNITTAGTYTISANVNCADGGSNSFFVNVDAQPTADMIWYVPLTSGIEARTVSWGPNMIPQLWDLSAGTHQLIVRGRESNARLGWITIAPALSAPANLRIVTP